jgi:hypothetical protein
VRFSFSIVAFSQTVIIIAEMDGESREESDNNSADFQDFGDTADTFGATLDEVELDAPNLGPGSAEHGNYLHLNKV